MPFVEVNVHNEIEKQRQNNICTNRMFHQKSDRCLFHRKCTPNPPPCF